MSKFWIGAAALVISFSQMNSDCLAQVPAAEALFRSARDAADQGDWVSACDRFQESYRLEPAPGTILNLARCREQLGQVASAWKSYEEVAQRLPENDKRVAFAKKKAADLEPRVPHVTFHSSYAGKGLVLLVDGVVYENATLGVALPFDPGALEVVVQAPDHQENRTELLLEEGQNEDYQLEVGELQLKEASGSPQLVKKSVNSSSKKWAYASIGVGSAGLLTAIGGAIWMGIEAPKVKADCDGSRCSTQAGADAAARGRTAVYMTAIGGGISLIGLGLGTYLLLETGENASVALAPLYGGGMFFYQGEL